mmetsp:Transcript_5011/g.7275  ORF Transcript_5011/g.7275 Transcript_5011/m.7275 type:complete len:552 (-) Transcript_5011:59-1714(-)
MAWRSSGTNNTEMVDKLKRFGVITSEHVERAFRRVDRKFFVPAGNETLAHSDQPLKEGNVHISAPHIYGSAIEALDLVPNSCTSFLNIGSGTGYVSAIVADILGPNSLHYGVELHDDVIGHCKASLAKWGGASVNENGSVSTINFVDDGTPDIHIVKGNGLNILKSEGESVVGYDRIYVGAAIDSSELTNITKLLSPGGILVGPVEDELVKVIRTGVVAQGLEEDAPSGDAASLSGLDEEFTSQLLSGVRFAPLATFPVIYTIIPSNVWNPSIRRFYPNEHRCASMALLMCSNSQIVQPPPRVPTTDERFNAAAMLPKSIWLEILSYTHRRWFAPEQNETDFLKRRLMEEKVKTAKAERARREAEARCHAAERERAVYRLLARRWQSRLNVLLSQQQEQGSEQEESEQYQHRAAEDLFNLLDAGAGQNNNANAALVQVGDRSTLAELRSLIQGQLSDINSEEEGDSASEDGSGAIDMEEDLLDEEEGDEEEEEDAIGEENLLEFLADENESVTSGRDRNNSVVMEDVEGLVATGQRSADQPRTVSISSYDL